MNPEFLEQYLIHSKYTMTISILFNVTEAVSSTSLSYVLKSMFFIQQRVVQPPYVGFFNTFSPVIEI